MGLLMTEYIFKNEPSSKIYLLTAIGSGDLTLTLVSGDGAKLPQPAAGQAFHICVSSGSTYEWMVCTARSSDSLTVTRGTPAYSFAAGAEVQHRLHEDALENLLQKGTEREVTTDPDGSLAALYTGEEVYQSVTGVWWKHCTSTTWKEMNL